MRLTYWVSECLQDSDCYNIRAKTKKECAALRAACNEDEINLSHAYGPVHKITIDYRDGFDLLYMCLNEGRIYEG